MNKITSKERARIYHRARILSANNERLDVVENLMRFFDISRDRAKHAAAKGRVFWNHPQRTCSVRGIVDSDG